MTLDQFVNMTAALGDDDLASDRRALMRALAIEIRRRSVVEL